ncbi:TetR family transcriptional regulator [Chloroflexia bacterium SDU3-3]|nr:TetR family transcriptional regulator [Chloroflexia bacterium SDU3-3]
MTPETAEGVRERKRRETRQRIAETGLRLFLSSGYEQTTLDTIAAEAGISRRTFFSYFKSKEDILFVWQSAGWAIAQQDLLAASPDEHPLDAVRDVFIRHVAPYTNSQMQAIDRLLRSSEPLRARKQAFYEEQERTLFATLCQIWRQPQRRPELRMVAMACIGAIRLSLEAWSQQDTPDKPLPDVIRESFAALRAGMR